MPGHHDAGNEYTSLEDAEAAAIFVRDEGLAGKYQQTQQCIIHNWLVLFRCHDLGHQSRLRPKDEFWSRRGAANQINI